jgi:hypothetical protein
MINIGLRRALAQASAAILALALGAAAPGRAAADDAVVLPFTSGGAFFSHSEKLARAVDPQIFIYDGIVAVGTGPQRIEHIAGLRNARLDDPPLSPLFNAEGMSLGLTLRKWLAARGVLETQTQADGRMRLIATFKHLVPFGTYSLFAERADADGGKTARPLDADGSTSSFEASADGSAMIVLETSPQTGGDTAVVLVYHSDGREHGVSRGRLGITAHQQLAARLSSSAASCRLVTADRTSFYPGRACPSAD